MSKGLMNLDARELNELGNVYVDQGMWDEALECYKRSLSLRREANDRRGEMVVLNNLGALYHRQERWEEALSYYSRSRHLAQGLGEESSELAILMNMIFIYVTRSDVEGFLQLADEAKELAQEVKGWTSLSILHRLRGRQALASSRDEEGMAHYTKALRFALREGEATLQEMLAHIDKEMERLVAEGSPGLALVFCDYLLIACEGIEEVRDHLARKREGLLSPPRLSGWKRTGEKG